MLDIAEEHERDKERVMGSAYQSPDHSAGRTIQTLLAFDYGLKNVGVAVGNTLTAQSRPLTTISAVGKERWNKIEAILQEWQPDALVVGVPFHPDGAEHENTLRARKFARQLQGRYRLTVHEVDERYTTTAAYEMGAVEQNADSMAAAIILQQYLGGSL